MKLKKIESICKNGACIRINRSPDGKLWIGDESAVYFVGGLKDITKEQLLTIFDIPEDKQPEYSVAESEIPYEDIDKAERLINRRLRTELCIRGRHYILYETDGKICCLNSKYLKPVDDEKNCTLYIRDGGRHIAVKKGMFLIAVISAFDFKNVDEITSEIEDIYHAL